MNSKIDISCKMLPDIVATSFADAFLIFGCVMTGGWSFSIDELINFICFMPRQKIKWAL